MNYLGFKPETVESTANQLNKLLSNYQVYYQNLRNYHWNISGEHFFELHEKFEELYNEAKTTIDEIAERVLTLRKNPTSTLAEYLEMADIKEHSTSNTREMVETILKNHEMLITNMREVISVASDAEDEGTIDLVGGFLSSIEKKSWMLDAWLTK